MKIASLCAIAAVLVSGSLFAQTPPPIPTLVITNAKVFTANPSKPYAEAIAILDDKIVGVGTNDEVLELAKKQTRRVDARGRRIIPAFNDAHVHLGMAPSSFVVDRGLDPSWEQIAPAIANAVDETPDDFWITVHIGPKILLDPSITAAKLDELAGKHRVRLIAFTGHGLMLSKAGREELGLHDTATDPPGGWYGRDAQGNFDGRIYEYAQYPLDRRFAELATDADLIGELRDLSNQAVVWGIGSIQVMPGVSVDRYRKIMEAADVPIRVRRIDFVVDPLSTERTTNANALKFILDGTPIERHAAVRKPYAKGETGRENFTDLTPFFRRASAGKQQIVFHASGDRTIASALQAMAKQSGLRRPRIEHGDGLQKDLFELARKTGVTIVQNPSHFQFRDAYPKDGDYFPMATLVKEKIPLAIGSDGVFNPFLNIMWAVARQDNKRESLLPEQAVAAYTRGSAYAEMRETDKGMIAPGMLADIVMLTQDILSPTLDPEAIPNTISAMTMIDGKIVFGDLR